MPADSRARAGVSATPGAALRPAPVDPEWLWTSVVIGFVSSFATGPVSFAGRKRRTDWGALLVPSLRSGSGESKYGLGETERFVVPSLHPKTTARQKSTHFGSQSTEAKRSWISNGVYLMPVLGSSARTIQHLTKPLTHAAPTPSFSLLSPPNYYSLAARVSRHSIGRSGREKIQRCYCR